MTNPNVPGEFGDRRSGGRRREAPTPVDDPFQSYKRPENKGVIRLILPESRIRCKYRNNFNVFLSDHAFSQEAIQANMDTNI